MKKKIIGIITILSFLIFILITYLLLNNKLAWLDTPVYNFISHHLINKVNTNILIFITSLGSFEVLFPIIIVLFILIKSTKRFSLYQSMLLFVWGSSYTLNLLLKHIFERPRPEILRLVNEYDYSYPSSHAMVNICFYGFIIYMIIKLVKSNKKYFLISLLSLLIFMIGFSRIYLGVHYTSDVIAGFSIGFVWLILCIVFLKKLLKLQKE